MEIFRENAKAKTTRWLEERRMEAQSETFLVPSEPSIPSGLAVATTSQGAWSSFLVGSPCIMSCGEMQAMKRRVTQGPPRGPKWQLGAGLKAGGGT